MVGGPAVEAVVVGGNAKAVEYAPSASVLQGQTVRMVLLVRPGSDPNIVSSVALSADWAGAGVAPEPVP